MTYLEFYEKLKEYKMIGNIWESVLTLIDSQINSKPDKDEYLKAFAIYFSLIDDGNIAMSLEPSILENKWLTKVNATEVLLSEDSEDKSSSFKLDDIRDEWNSNIKSIISNINPTNLPEIIGDKKIFEIDNNWLYLRKYYVAREEIINNIGRLITTPGVTTSSFNYKDIVVKDFTLSEGQEKAVIKGESSNLLITGGPGTGKTTSILFILLNILSKKLDYYIYMVAPSGKAASRMKESIIKGISVLEESYKDDPANKKLLDKIQNLEEYTIHRLLSYNPGNDAFNYNCNHQFPRNSIFVIDEASMIDVCIFDALLQAIPNEARVFIMGDKNQLPSVEAGAVFGDLLEIGKFSNNIIELDASIRFGKETKIYELAEAINKESALPVKDGDWEEYTKFGIKADDKTKPIFYYKDSKVGAKDKVIIQSVVEKWWKEYYEKLQNSAMGLDENDISKLTKLFELSENGRILCAHNNTQRGVKSINSFIKNKLLDQTKKTSVIGHYAGELMMITKNNSLLNLYNGDSGILVTFKNDPTLYFMVKKASSIVTASGKKEDKIFKLGEFMFYPLRMISMSEIELSYAITIHKSQGSDYKNILVILPKSKGHPLLNRQIIYTAITRTKGNTYILSNQERFEEASKNLIVRDTNIK